MTKLLRYKHFDTMNSISISILLNHLGYSEDGVKLRQETSEKLSLDYGSWSEIVCGSKSEGLTLVFENDIDVMKVIKSLECREAFDDYSSNSGLIKFKLTRRNTTSPGYALLECISLNNTTWSDLTKSCLVDVGNGTYLLSSESLRQSFKEHLHKLSSSPGNDGFITYARKCQGPSCPSHMFGTCADNVLAIRCHSPQLIASWKRRRRLHDWPSTELIDTVSSLEAHVVPVGYKDSPLRFLEWRICFTKAEICLIRSLNDCQTKLIILLKMIAKHVLKPVCTEMSTYVVKNLVLWMAEKHPSKQFVEDKLLERLNHALKFLKRCIINKELPCYMIKERNLFADRISDSKVLSLCETIEILLNEGPKMLLRCPKIRDGWNTFRLSPDQFYLISEKRRCLELRVLDLICSSIKHCFPLFANDDGFTWQQVFRYLLSQDEHVQLCSRYEQFFLPYMPENMGSGRNWIKASMERLIYELS